jgi:hypothetical protein
MKKTGGQPSIHNVRIAGRLDCWQVKLPTKLCQYPRSFKTFEFLARELFSSVTKNEDKVIKKRAPEPSSKPSANNQADIRLTTMFSDHPRSFKNDSHAVLNPLSSFSAVLNRSVDRTMPTCRDGDDTDWKQNDTYKNASSD